MSDFFISDEENRNNYRQNYKDQLVQQTKQIGQERLENRQRYGVELNDKEYAQINNLISDSDNYDEEAHKIGSSILFSKQLDIPVDEAYTNLDAYIDALWGNDKPTNYRSAFTAIGDMFIIGNNGLKLGNLGNKLREAELSGDQELIDQLYKEIDLIDKDNEYRQDNAPRTWITEAIKTGAQTIPFSAQAAGLGLFGNFLAPGVGTMLSFGASTSAAAGQEYIDMRKEGVSARTANTVSAISGAIQGLIEVALGTTETALAAGAGKNFAKTTAGQISKKAAENFAKRFHYGPGKKVAVQLVSDWIADKLGEGTEEALQEVTSIISEEVARSMDGLGLSDKTIKERTKQVMEAFKGGVVGAIVLGIPFDVARGNADLKQYNSLKNLAATIDSEEMFMKEAEKNPVVEGMKDETKRQTLHDIWERTQDEMEAAELHEARAVSEVNTADESFENIETDEETGENNAAPVVRDELTGGLIVQSDITEENGNIKKESYRAGDNTKEDKNLYGYINATIDEDNKTVTIDKFSMNDQREGLRNELFDNYARDHAGYDIQWNPKLNIAKSVKERLVEANPSGKNNGLNYYSSKEEIANVETRKKVASQIREAYKKVGKTLTTDQVAADVAILESMYNRLGRDLTDRNINNFSDYINYTFGENIFGNAEDLKEEVNNQENGTTVMGASLTRSLKDFDRGMKALIYVTENGDFSTFSHEVAHIARKQLQKELLDEAAAAFNVKKDENGEYIWTREDEENFAFGFEQFLMTGKAKNEGLKTLFQKLAQFLVDCFNELKQIIDITPEIENVYNELLAGDKSTLAAAKRAAEQSDIEHKAQAEEEALQKQEEERKAAADKYELEQQEREANQETTDYEEEIEKPAVEETTEETEEEIVTPEQQIENTVDNTTLTEEQKQDVTDILTDPEETVAVKEETIQDVAAEAYDDEALVNEVMDDFGFEIDESLFEDTSNDDDGPISQEEIDALINGIDVFGDENDIPNDLFFQTKEDENATYNKAVKYLETFNPKERKRILNNLETHKGTPWYKSTIKALSAREDINAILNGMEVSDDSLVKNVKTYYDVLTDGDTFEERVENLYDYFDCESALVGEPLKCLYAVGASFANCNPSIACAKYCYAATGRTGTINSQIVNRELVNWCIEHDPKKAADIVRDQYIHSREYKNGGALRLLDTGDLSEKWLDFIKYLNSGDELGHDRIACQIFSKRPELLSQIDRDLNVVLLSIDETNEYIAEEWNNLPVAYVLSNKNGIPFIINNKTRFTEYGGSILPAVMKKKADTLTARAALKELPKWTLNFTCPIDAGWKEIGNNKKRRKNKKLWNCSVCDANGQGCFFMRAIKDRQGFYATLQEMPTGVFNAVEREFKRAAAAKLRAKGFGESDIRSILETFDNIRNEKLAGIDTEGTGSGSARHSGSLRRTTEETGKEKGQNSSKETNVENPQLLYQTVTDPKEIERLNNEPTVKAYRAMQLIDGKLYPPMSAKINGKLRDPIELGQWERADENPEMANDKGYFTLNKGNGKSVPARYNPYFHSSPTMLNDQFAEAQDRPNLVTVEVEIPASELNSKNPYRAEKAKDAVGTKKWKAGIVQAQLSGKRTVHLSRWDKPVRIVPNEEVAANIIESFDGTDIVMPSNVVPPAVRSELEKKGIQFVNTNNTGKLTEGENAGQDYYKVYGNKEKNILFQITQNDQNYGTKGLYLAANIARHDDYDMDYNDYLPKYNTNLVGDMMEVDLEPYDYIIATPPCNYWSRANYRRETSKYAQETKHLLPDILEKLGSQDKPFLIENVRNDVLMEEAGIFDILKKYGIKTQVVGRHRYYTNLDVDLETPQEKDFSGRGKTFREYQPYRQGGVNVHRVVEKWLNAVMVKKQAEKVSAENPNVLFQSSTIPDFNIKEDPIWNDIENKDNSYHEGILSDIIESEELFNTYPELKNIKVDTKLFIPSTDIMYNFESNTISINAGYEYSKNDEKDRLLNELYNSEEYQNWNIKLQQLDENDPDYVQKVKDLYKTFDESEIGKKEQKIENLPGSVKKLNKDIKRYLNKILQNIINTNYRQIETESNNIDQVRNQLYTNEAKLNAIDFFVKSNRYLQDLKEFAKTKDYKDYEQYAESLFEKNADQYTKYLTAYNAWKDNKWNEIIKNIDPSVVNDWESISKLSEKELRSIAEDTIKEVRKYRSLINEQNSIDSILFQSYSNPEEISFEKYPEYSKEDIIKSWDDDNLYNEMQEKDAAVMNSYRQIMDDPSFVAMQITMDDGHIYYIHHNPRDNGYKWQLSNFDKYGPYSHVNFDELQEARDRGYTVPLRPDKVEVIYDDEVRYDKPYYDYINSNNEEKAAALLKEYALKKNYDGPIDTEVTDATDIAIPPSKRMKKGWYVQKDYDTLERDYSLLFQTQAELYAEARAFPSWVEFMDFYQNSFDPVALEDPMYHSQVPSDADAQWYQTTWELANGIQPEESMRNEEVAEKHSVENMDKNAMDSIFASELVNNPSMFDDFMHMVAYYENLDLEREYGQVANEEEAAERDHIDEIKTLIDRTMTSEGMSRALNRIAAGGEITPDFKKRLISEMANAARDFRSLYAEVMGDPTYRVNREDTIEVLNEKKRQELNKRYDLKLPEINQSTMTPRQRVEYANNLENEEIAARLRDGTLKMDDQVDKYIKSLKDQINEQKRMYKELQSKILEETERIADEEQQDLLKLNEKLNQLKHAVDKHDNEMMKKLSQGLKISAKYKKEAANLKHDYNEIMRKYKDALATTRITAEVQRALDMQEKLSGALSQINKLEEERVYMGDVQKMRKNLVKRTMRRVKFDTVDYDYARQIIAIQRVFEPNLLGGVNKWIGQRDPYLRGIISAVITDKEYKNEMTKHISDRATSSKAYAEFIEKWTELITSPTVEEAVRRFNTWDEKTRKRAITYLPKEDWIKELQLKELEQEREDAIDLDIEIIERRQPMKDEKGNFIYKPQYDEKGNKIKAPENQEMYMKTMYSLEASDEIKNMIKDAVGEDIYDNLLYRPFNEWTIEEMERLAQRVDNLYTEGRDILAAKKKLQVERAAAIRQKIEKAVKDTGIVINDDDTPEEKQKKQEKIDKILGLTPELKGTVAAKDTGFKARLNRLLHGYIDANVLRVSRILDGGTDGINVQELYRKEDECYNSKTRSINNRVEKINKVMADNNITMDDLAQQVKVGNMTFTIDELLFFAAANEDYVDDPLKLMKKETGILANDDWAATSRNAVMFGNLYSDTEHTEFRAECVAMDEEMQRRIDNDELTQGEKNDLIAGMLDKHPGTSRYVSRCHNAMISVIAAAEKLDDKYKALLKVIADDYAEQYDRMNEISIKEFNTPVHRVKCYVPLVRLESNGDTNVNQVKEDLLAAMGQGSGKQWVNKGMTKRRTNMSPLNQKPVQTGLYKTWADSIERTEHFISYSAYVRELNRVYKSRDAQFTRQYIENRYGRGMLSYLDDYINEVANPNANKIREKGAELLHTLRGKTAPAYLAWKASAIIKQGLTSPWPYMQFINPAEYMAASWKCITSKGEMYDAIRQKSVFMQNRVMDPMNDLIDEMAEKTNQNKFDKALNKFNKKGMAGLEWIDWVCVAPGWLACYDKKLAELEGTNENIYEETKQRLQEENYYAEVGTPSWKSSEQIEKLARKAQDDDLEKRAVEYADDCTRACQPSNRSVDISPLFKNSSEAMKAYLQFQTSLNVIWQNIRYDIPYAIRKNEFSRVAMTIIGYALAGIFMNSVMDGLGGDDDDDGSKVDDRLKNLVFYATTQFTDAVPMVGSELTNTMDKLITGKQQFMNSGTDMTPTMTKIFSIMTNTKSGNYQKAAEMTADGIAMYLGLPVSGGKEIRKLLGVGDGKEGLGINLETVGNVYGILDPKDYE